MSNTGASIGQAADLLGVRIDTAVRLGDVAVQVEVEVQSGPRRLVSLLIREAVEELHPEVGTQVTARVKSTSVHVERG